ncbi:MAG TPA: sigma-70 family RNA polymerase sigma factor, partial [Ktedonobacterales bacterium]|nr:sigma-70 family RNA polymerase sigma factor [Ktedonobacterales bacterium]
ALQRIPFDNLDDVVQETLIEAWRHVEQLRHVDRFDAWLDGICRNVCQRSRVKQARLISHEMPLVFTASDGEETPMSDIPAVDDPLEDLTRPDIAQICDRALGYLSAPARMLVELRYLQELPQREIAARTGLSESAIEAQLFRARHSLRSVLSTDLRGMAEEYGLYFADPVFTGWRETREYCFVCGKQRMLGIFETLADGRTSLRMKCPTCTPANNAVETGGVVPLSATHSFRPALKRATKMGADFFTQALIHQGDHRCPICGLPQVTALVLNDLPSSPDPIHRIAVTCSCGTFVSWSLAIFLGHPQVFDFMFQSSRCIVLPEKHVTFDNKDALRFTLVDLENGERLHIFAHPISLALFAVVAE